MSLKPFRAMDESAIRQVCETAFRQWAPLAREAEGISVMLWSADGSELLEYGGDLDAEIEWARYIGHPNPRHEVPNDPHKKALHSRAYLYTEHPPRITYRDLGAIVRLLKEVGQEMTGKPVRVGATFDPGGEFARSPFKYDKHNEICLGGTMGKGSFVCCYATLNGDTQRYAGFPDGIPDGTPFGTFLGRQSKYFLRDLGFDYIWFSNGFGFGLEAWKTTGPLFDGEKFDAGRAAEIRDKILDFWQLFRAECPDAPIETRGTNLGTGVDLASDAAPLRDIYNGDFNMAAPPNSPWAALDGDFGIELAGYMSRIAELPRGRGFPFRFYVHDPWWLNSPWLDRYGREPHDIYLPLSIGRVDENGATQNPDSISILTIDDSYGRMPEECPNEVIPHLLRAAHDAPDAPGPLVWIYPFDEFHDNAFGDAPRLEVLFFHDWFIRSAINRGLPLNTVVSSRNFLSSVEGGCYRDSILVSLVPQAGSPLSGALLRHVAAGGKVLLFGPLARADESLLQALNLRVVEPIEGEMKVLLSELETDETATPLPQQMQHRALMSAGGIETVVADENDAHTRIAAQVVQGDAKRVAALSRRLPAWNGGTLAYVRGTNSNSYKAGQHLLQPDDAGEWFPGDLLMRLVLQAFDYDWRTRKREPKQRDTVTTVARARNGFYFSGYVPDMTVELQMRFPHGAPLLIGCEAELKDGRACYRMPRAWHRECRVFIEQQDGVVSCVEQISGAIGITRRLRVTGLQNATVRFFPDTSIENAPVLQQNPIWPFIEGPFVDAVLHGSFVQADNISGDLLISW